MTKSSTKNKKSPGLWNIRTLVFVVGILFLVIQLSLLAINIYLYVEDPKAHVTAFLDWFLDHGVKVPLCDENIILSPSGNSSPLNQGSPSSSSIGNQDDNSLNFVPSSSTPSRSNNNRECIIRKSGDYLAIPVTINLVLILADILLIWATAARIKLWLWPWMILHTIEMLFFITLLVLLMVLIEEPWIKVVIFLIGCPVIILLGFFLFVINCFYKYLQDLNLKEAASTAYAKSNSGMPSSFARRVDTPQPPTMYTTEPHGTWDQPPIWAVNPPQTIWDPEYLQKFDPRYNSDSLYGRNHPKVSSKSAPLHRKMQNRQDKLRGVEAILPDGTIVVPLVDEDEYVEDYEEEFDTDPAWYAQDMDDFRARYPRGMTTIPRPSHTPSHREISTKALTKSSRLPREQDMWDDDHYLGSFENQGFEDEIAQNGATTYNKQEQRNKSSRYANVNFHHNEYGPRSRKVSESELDDGASDRHHWGSSSVPGSLSDKYRGGDLYAEDTEGSRPEDIHKIKKRATQQQKMKSTVPVRDDGVITTISQQEEHLHDDRCSSVISLSDKYRAQEEIQIFQENFHYKPPPDPIRPNQQINKTASEMSTVSLSSSNTKNTDVPNSDKLSSEEKEPDKEDNNDLESTTTK